MEHRYSPRSHFLESLGRERDVSLPVYYGRAHQPAASYDNAKHRRGFVARTRVWIRANWGPRLLLGVGLACAVLVLLATRLVPSGSVAPAEDLAGLKDSGAHGNRAGAGHAADASEDRDHARDAEKDAVEHAPDTEKQKKKEPPQKDHESPPVVPHKRPEVPKVVPPAAPPPAPAPAPAPAEKKEEKQHNEQQHQPQQQIAHEAGADNGNAGQQPIQPAVPPAAPPTQPDPLWASRAESVKAAFLHAWDGYRTHAWGYDHLLPLSKRGEDWFGLGLTITDSLSTMWIMNLTEEFKVSRDWIASDLRFSHDGDSNVFEVTIRALAGLLSAHAFSHDPIFLSRAKELADILLPAFDTSSKLPLASINFAKRQAVAAHFNGGASSTAEVATLQLEFKYLAALTNDPRYWKAVENVMLVIESLPKLDGLVPIFISPISGKFEGSEIRLGSRGDSYYEYLLKQYLQTNRTEPSYRRAWDEAVAGIKKRLVAYSKPHNLTFVGELPQGASSHTIHPKMDHLVCFLGGALALGASPDGKLITDRSKLTDLQREDLKLAEELTHTCYEMYRVQATGLAPEIVYFNTEPDKKDDIEVRPLDAHNLLRPETVESLFVLYRITGDQKYREWGWEIFESFIKFCRVESGGFTSLVGDRPWTDRHEKQELTLGDNSTERRDQSSSSHSRQAGILLPRGNPEISIPPFLAYGLDSAVKLCLQHGGAPVTDIRCSTGVESRVGRGQVGGGKNWVVVLGNLEHGIDRGTGYRSNGILLFKRVKKVLEFQERGPVFREEQPHRQFGARGRAPRYRRRPVGCDKRWPRGSFVQCTATHLLDLFQIILDRIEPLPQRIVLQIQQLEPRIQFPHESRDPQRADKVAEGDTVDGESGEFAGQGDETVEEVFDANVEGWEFAC